MAAGIRTVMVDGRGPVGLGFLNRSRGTGAPALTAFELGVPVAEAVGFGVVVIITGRVLD